ncbi:hypothetical protein [Pectobacterium carotovorum]|uniref:hypothetical protein n=1 Tax=Pectobacterium carotovorum TaxID=554 RepID=UPI000D8AB07C|nr:hypothetical protein [Pectobacterium carotovorum]PXB01172.1 hypothetical protein DMB41_16390 [Pectobacterium carotovorum subsp. carotovorum]
MSGYTKGPWEWENGVLRSDKYIVGGNSHSFNASNKALIAAAPDLLEALVDMVESYEHEASAENPSLLKARAAIAKAKGES